MISTAILIEQSRIVFNGGYRLPTSKSAAVTIVASFSADTKNISSGMVNEPAQITPSATPGKMYELLPWPG